MATGAITKLAKHAANLIQLLGVAGTNLINHKSNYLGSVSRSLLSKLMDKPVSIKDFGAIGDGTLHPVSEWYTPGFTAYRGYANLAAVQVDYPHVTRAAQSIDWAAIQAACNAAGNKSVFAPAGVYWINELLQTSAPINGEGYDYWDLKGSWRPRRMAKGTTFLVGGPAPVMTVEVVNVSNMRVAGGVILNGDAASSIYENYPGNQTYELLDFTNGDAVGATKATPKKLKVGVQLKNNAILTNLRVQLNYLGVDGYNSANVLPDFPEFTQDRFGLGDNWDIGVLSYNAMQTGVQNCQVVGYWRMMARAAIASNFGDGKSFGGTIFNDRQLFYQGFVGLGIRGNDVHRITAIDATTVSVPWNASHTVPASGSCYLGGTAYSYTGLALSGDKLVLSGFSIDPSSKTTVGAECYFGTNPGFSGSSVADGFISGMGHFSNYRSYDPILEEPTAFPSKALELSGSPLRDIDFTNIHLFDTDMIAFSHDALHTSFVGCYAEAQGFSGGAPGGAKGARYIASCRTELADAQGLYPAGNTAGLYWDRSSEMSDGSVDLFPVYRSTTPRFNSANKYFMPDNFQLDCVGYWTKQAVGSRRYDHGPRLYTDGPYDDYSVISTRLGPLVYQQVWDALNRRVGFADAKDPAVDLHHSGLTSVMRMQVPSGAQDPQYQWTNANGTWTARPQMSSINQWQLRYGSTILFNMNPTTGTQFAGTTGTADVGTATVRYRDGFWVNAPNVSSDLRLKQDIEDIPQAWLDAALLVRLLTYRLKDMVAQKGAGARNHMGVIAQEVIAAFEGAGVDPFQVGIVCHAQWDDQYEHLVDEEGNDTGERVLVREAGEEYSVRYEELLVLVVAAERQEMRKQVAALREEMRQEVEALRALIAA